jgi:polysaccharide pyruvyl transferase WcaK-like protein
VLLAPSGGGNLGDQALLEAYLRATSGPVRVLVNSIDALTMPAEHAERITVVSLPGLTNSRLLYRPGTRRKVREALDGAASFTAIGMDVMDGGYGPREAVLRSNLLWLAGTLGVPSRLVSFSFNETPHPAAVAALRRAAGVSQLFVRDPRSFERLERLGVPNLHRSADLVFTLSDATIPESVGDWVETHGAHGFAVVNVSGLIGLTAERLEAYVDTVDWLLGYGLAVLLLPHVIRRGDDDLLVVKAVHAHFSTSRVGVVPELLTPSEVAWLAARARVILSGRMHLAVIGLTAGTPCAVFSTQGKVQGLLESVGLGDFLLSPSGEVAGSARSALERLLADETVRPRLVSSAHRLRLLAQSSMEGLQQELTATAAVG